jgi:hypothetical protein
MQTTMSLRKPSINSVAVSSAIVLALAAGVSGSYWLKSQAAPVASTSRRPAPSVLPGPATPAHDMPEVTGTQVVKVPTHDMPEETGVQPVQVPNHDMPEQP